MLIVYSKSACVQCNATIKSLQKYNLDFDIINLDDNPEALETVKSMGYMQAPVVVAGDKSWSGFRPDKIAEIVSEGIYAMQN